MTTTWKERYNKWAERHLHWFTILVMFPLCFIGVSVMLTLIGYIVGVSPQVVVSILTETPIIAIMACVPLLKLKNRSWRWLPLVLIFPLVVFILKNKHVYPVGEMAPGIAAGGQHEQEKVNHV